MLLGAIDPELDLFLVWAQERKLAEADVEGRAGQGAIVALDDNNVNGATKSGRIDRVPGRGNRIAEVSHVLHRAGSKSPSRPREREVFGGLHNEQRVTAMANDNEKNARLYDGRAAVRTIRGRHSD